MINMIYLCYYGFECEIFSSCTCLQMLFVYNTCTISIAQFYVCISYGDSEAPFLLL